MANDDLSEFDIFEGAATAYTQSLNPLLYIRHALSAYNEPMGGGFTYVSDFAVEAGQPTAECKPPHTMVRFPWRGTDGVVGVARRPRDPNNAAAVCYDQRLGDPDSGNSQQDDPAAFFYNAQRVYLPRLDAMDLSGLRTSGRAIHGVLGSLDELPFALELRQIQQQRRGKTAQQLYGEALGLIQMPNGQFVTQEAFQAACALDPYCQSSIVAALQNRPHQVVCAETPGCVWPTAPVPAAPAATPVQPVFAPLPLMGFTSAPQQEASPMAFAPSFNLSDLLNMNQADAEARAEAEAGGVVGEQSGGGGGVVGDWIESIPYVGGLLNDFLEVATSREGLQVAGALAQAGVIRGSLGDLLAPQRAVPTTLNINGQQVSQQAFQAACERDPYCVAEIGRALRGEPSQPRSASMAFSLESGLENLAGYILAAAQGNGGVPAGTGNNEFDVANIEDIPEELLQAIQRRLFGTNTASVPDASNLFRARPGGSYLPSRIQVKGPDGQIHVLINAGRATRGSREKSVMRRLARDNGFKLARYGTGGGRSRRRPR